MSRRPEIVRGVRRVAELGVAALGAIGFLPGRASAVSGTASGYWYAARPPGAPLPPPPNVPAHGLWISSNPAGPVAVAAVRLVLDAGDAPPVLLSLRIDRETPAGAASVFACPATSPWTAVEGGSAADAPKYDCSSARVVGVKSSDGSRLVFDLTSLVASKGLDVVLVPTPMQSVVPPAVPALPGTPAPAPPSATFDVTFQPFTADQVAVVTAPASASGGSQGVQAGGLAASASMPAVASAPAAALPGAAVPSSAGGAIAEIAGGGPAPTVAPPARSSLPTAPAAVPVVDRLHQLSARARAVLGAVLLALVLWEASDGRIRSRAPTPPHRTLNDPAPVPAVTQRREGRPPPLR
jgi:hypothetical protein